MKKNDLVFLVAIANQKEKQNLLNEISNIGGHVFNIINGHGSIRDNNLEQLGIDVEQNKVIITCLIKEEKSIKTLESLITKFKFNEPNTGIAFTIPVEKAEY